MVLIPAAAQQDSMPSAPVVKFIMGVPALNWVIIVIIWFSTTELRIGFVLIVLCTPVTVFCVYDGVRSIDRKLTDMVLAFGAIRNAAGAIAAMAAQSEAYLDPR